MTPGRKATGPLSRSAGLPDNLEKAKPKATSGRKAAGPEEFRSAGLQIRIRNNKRQTIG